MHDGRSALPYCAALAVAAVALRILLVDHAFLALEHVPSHDMSQGVAFFATSMHSVRLTGDIAWWFPGSYTGYAQYLQGFFAPLAPSNGHIVFIAWSHLVAILASLGWAMPEYVQYLVVDYVVFPLLAFTAFGYFCSRFLRTRAALALAMIAYVLSGIGLWNSAWFYFQEAFSVFFLLGASLALLQQPVASRLLIWLAAALVQLASLNYWTMYNLLFVAFVLGAYGAAHRFQVLRLARRVRALAAAHPAAARWVGAGVGLVAATWTAVIASAWWEQGGNQVRVIYTVDQLLWRAQEVRRYTTELFNPWIARALQGYPIDNEIHSARYIGVVLLPLAALAVLTPGRRTRWLLGCALLTLAVCLGSTFVVWAWDAIPSMDRIQHFLYFYSHYWQLVAVLLAAVGMDAFIALSSGTRRLALATFGAAIALAAFTMAAFGALTHEFKANDPNLQGNLRAALLLAIAGVVLFRAAWSMSPRERRFAVAGVLFILLVDLAAYFQTASRIDMRFTQLRGWGGVVPSDRERAALARPWGSFAPERGFGGGLDEAMPISNQFWPFNRFMLPADLPRAATGAFGSFVRSAPPFAYYDAARPIAATETLPAALAADPRAIDRELLVVAPPAGAAAVSTRVLEGFAYRWNRLDYNGFEVEVTAPRDGWLMARQLHDRSWRLTVDGAAATLYKANYLSMAVPLAAGRHVLRWEYRPLARALYWPAAALLEWSVAALLAAAWMARRSGSATR